MAVPKTKLASMSLEERKALRSVIAKLQSPRSGVIVTYTGLRAGTWKSFDNAFTAEANRSELREILAELKRDGILTEVSASPIGKNARSNPSSKISSVGIRHIPLGQAPIGDIDVELKRRGYFMVELEPIGG